MRYTDDEIVVILSTNDSEVRGGRISHALGRMAHGDDVPAPKPPVAAGAAKPLGASARDAVIRTFRNAHATPRPWVDDAEREKRLTQMRDDLGRLDPDGIVDSADAEVTVRAKGSNGPVGTFKFMFAPDGKLDGIGVEVGN